MSDSAITQQQVVARIERLPFSAWHVRVLSIVGIANFFDAFDSLTIAFVLPVLAGLWHLAPQEIGYLISIGFLGQLIGAVILSYFAERAGRITPLRWSIAIISLFALCCAAAWSYGSFLTFRLLQGLGLGAENPIASAYIGEMSGAKLRGRMAFAFQAVFACAIFITAMTSLWVVPHWGWQWMFVIGAVPAFLALWLRRLVPESPRWLVGVGRTDEAERTLAAIEAEVSKHGAVALPAPTQTVAATGTERARFASLFEPTYRGRTLLAWVMMFCASTVSYGLITWLPTIYRTVYNLPLAQTLQYGFYSSIASVGGALIGFYVIDRVTRRALFITCFLASGSVLVVLGLILNSLSVPAVVALATLGIFAMSFISNAVYVYIPETYPTRMRALGAGVASAWLRIAAIIGPSIVGILLGAANLMAVFEFFGITALIGAVAVFCFAIETRGRVLEEVSP